MAENLTEQELQALFRKHMPVRRMHPELAARLKKQVLIEVAATLERSNYSTVSALSYEERERILDEVVITVLADQGLTDRFRLAVYSGLNQGINQLLSFIKTLQSSESVLPHLGFIWFHLFLIIISGAFLYAFLRWVDVSEVVSVIAAACLVTLGILGPVLILRFTDNGNDSTTIM